MQRLLCLLGALAGLGAPAWALAQPAGLRMSREGQVSSGNWQLDRQRGRPAARGLIRQAGLSCRLRDAAYLGLSRHPEHGEREVYELACDDRPGLLAFVTRLRSGMRLDGRPDGLELFDCFEAAANPSVAGNRAPSCRLPANRPDAALRAAVRPLRGGCAVTAARFVGREPETGVARYEVGCRDQAGFVLVRDFNTADPSRALSCWTAERALGQPCALTARPALLSEAARLAAASGRPCRITDVRPAGLASSSGRELLEVGCGDRLGFYLELADAATASRVLDCGDRVAEPCRLTSAEAIRAGELSDVARRLADAGFRCRVSAVRQLGVSEQDGRDVLEAACADRPDGVWAILPNAPGQTAELYDCLRAPYRAGECRLTQASALFPALSASTRLRDHGCRVVAAHRLGTTAEGEHWIEVACAGGDRRVIDYRGSSDVRRALSCGAARHVLGGCRAASTRGS